MTNVQRIRKGPHLTPRPSGEPTSYTFDEKSFLGSYEHLPGRVRGAILGVILAGAVAVGGTMILTQHQGKPDSNTPAPTEQDYQAHEGQPLNGS